MPRAQTFSAHRLLDVVATDMEDCIGLGATPPPRLTARLQHALAGIAEAAAVVARQPESDRRQSEQVGTHPTTSPSITFGSNASGCFAA